MSKPSRSRVIPAESKPSLPRKKGARSGAPSVARSVAQSKARPRSGNEQMNPSNMSHPGGTIDARQMKAKESVSFRPFASALVDLALELMKEQGKKEEKR